MHTCTHTHGITSFLLSRSRWKRALKWCRLSPRTEEGEGEQDGEGERERKEDVETGFEILEYADSPKLSREPSAVNPLTTTEDPLAIIEEGVESRESKVVEEGSEEGSEEPDDLEDFLE